MQISLFTAIKSSEKIDKDAGIIYGVQVIREGDAEGHDLSVDGKTLKQVKELASEFSGGLKVRAKHPSTGQEVPVSSIIGSLKKFRIVDKCLRADLHLLKSDENFAKYIELAETQPENFGLSIVFKGVPEEKDDVKLARCDEIYACDLADEPAATTGLFSKKPYPNLMNEEQIKLAKSLGLPDECTLEQLNAKLTSIGVINFAAKIKYKKGDSGDHADDCECKMCMSAGSKAEAKDTEAKLASAIDAKVKEMVNPFKTELETFRAEKANAVALSQKTQIETLIADAARDGKVIPFETADLYTEKDGKITILTTPEQLSKVISKLQPNTVKLAKPVKVEPKGADGKAIQIFGLNKTPEQIAMVREFASRQQEINAPIIGAHIKRLQTEAATQSMN